MICMLYSVTDKFSLNILTIYFLSVNHWLDYNVVLTMHAVSSPAGQRSLAV